MRAFFFFTREQVVGISMDTLEKHTECVALPGSSPSSPCSKRTLCRSLLRALLRRQPTTRACCTLRAVS